VALVFVSHHPLAPYDDRKYFCLDLMLQLQEPECILSARIITPIAHFTTIGLRYIYPDSFLSVAFPYAMKSFHEVLYL
jgi:hypothetical protein